MNVEIYNAIINALRSSKPDYNEKDPSYEASRFQWNDDRDTLAAALEDADPCFDYNKFIVDCTS